MTCEGRPSGISEFGYVPNVEGDKAMTLNQLRPRLRPKRSAKASEALGTESRRGNPRPAAVAWRASRGIGATAVTENRRANDEPVRTGVSALADEIDERLSSLRGARTEDLREVRREFSVRLKDAAPHVVIELATLLLETPRIEYRFIAYELIHHHPSALSHLNAWQLEQLGHGISSWAAVDCFAVYLAGPIWRERRIPNSLIHGWARSADRWWRRAAVVATVPLNSKAQGGRGDTYRTLQICRIVERDRDPIVVKALSWALRELAKHDARAVREYLADRKDVLAGLVLREVNNKLATGTKNPRAK
jgi:3-methyladenine DNA glycosylase AlkD